MDVNSSAILHYTDTENGYSLFVYPIQKDFSYFNHLNSAEEEYFNNILSPQRRLEFNQSRFWLKKIISEKSKLQLSEISFSLQGKGKPFLSTKKGALSPLYFNLSHCKDYIAIAISEKNSVGVDIQEKILPQKWERIAQKVFLPEEFLLTQRNPHKFFRFWTAKESQAKCLGDSVLGFPSKEFNSFYFDSIPGVLACVSIEKSDK